MLFHIRLEAIKYGIDKKKICLAGDAWLVAGVANILQKDGGLGNLVKAIFMYSGMLSNEPNQDSD